MGFPWETVIKLYRAQKVDKSEPTIEAWAKDLVAFLRTFGPIRKKDISQNVRSILESSFDELEALALQVAVSRNVSVPSKEFEKIQIELITKRKAVMDSRKPSFSAAAAARILKVHEKELVQIIGDYLKGSKNAQLLDEFVGFASRVLVSDHFSPLSTGVAIAGFGNRETFPAMASFETDGFIGNRLKLSRPDITRIDQDMRSCVRAFAQRDIVIRFMEGIDPFYSRYLDGIIRTAFIEGSLKVFDRWSPISKRTKKARAAVRRAAQKQISRVDEAATSYRGENFVQPTVRMVALLPKDELAHLAESLVELTALHRKVSAELETVGGPIDVAVISKSDGFVWIKRKYYFKAELNPQFQRNYMREIDG
jgi:hypothetical protein